MKNKFMRIAAVMLMLCLVTTCAISGTFAKYTDKETATDSARVAKWGISFTVPTDAENNGSFTPTYTKDEGTFDLTVKAANGTDDLVAPGTTGTLVTPIVNGTTEVAVAITVDATLDLTGWEVGGEFYCPIVFKVGSTEIKQDGTNDTADKLEAAVVNAIKAYSKNYEANTAIDEIPAPTWTWEFEGENDKDTALGTAGTAKIEYSITVTATQIN